MLVTVGLLIVLTVALSLVKFPYVIERPGPVANTLGDVTIEGKTEPIIQISGHETFETDGELNLLTVSLLGNPDDSVGWFDLLAAALDPTQEILPMEQFYPTGVTPEDRAEENRQEMTSSQDLATAAALTQLGIAFTQQVEVSAVSEQGPANGLLQSGDIIESVNAVEVTSYQVLREQIEANGTEKPAVFSILRNGESRDIAITPVEITEGDATSILIGVGVKTNFDFPFDVKIRVDEIGGPSAGLMFALGITDKLTQSSLSDGRIISGTGTIDAAGSVGAIGGLPQKIVSARRAESDLIFIPADQCAEVPANEFQKIWVVPVATLNDAVDALTELKRTDDFAQLPSCESTAQAESSAN